MYDTKKDFSTRIDIGTCQPCNMITNGNEGNESYCNHTVVAYVIRWDNNWAVVLYSLEFLVLLAVLLCLGYFLKNRSSPLVRSSYSCHDNVLMTLLCLFCLSPMMHVGELSAERCVSLWPVVNVLFVFYAALLLTKTLLVRKLLECRAPTGNGNRRMAFAVVILILQLIILATLPFSGFPTPSRFSCPSRGVVVVCDIQGNVSILSSMAFNWLCLFVLFVLTLVEKIKHRGDLYRTKHLTGVAFIGILSYTCLISCAYFNLQLENYMLVTFTIYALYLMNPIACLARLYLPTVYLINTCLRQQKKFHKCSQVMSPRREVPPVEIYYNYLFHSSAEHEKFTPSTSHSSWTARLSYPSSLVCGVRDSIHVVPYFGAMETYHVYRAQSCESFYDNVPSRASPFLRGTSSYAELPGDNIIDIELTYEELKQILSFLKGLRSSDV